MDSIENLVYLMFAVGIIALIARLFKKSHKTGSSAISHPWRLSGFSGVAFVIMASAGVVGAEKFIYGIAVVTVIGAFILGYQSVANRWAGPFQSAFNFVKIWLIFAVGSLLLLFSDNSNKNGAYMFCGATMALFLVCLSGGLIANRRLNS